MAARSSFLWPSHELFKLPLNIPEMNFVSEFWFFFFDGFAAVMSFYFLEGKSFNMLKMYFHRLLGECKFCFWVCGGGEIIHLKEEEL